MTDFRQLALEFVLSDDDAKQTSLSQQAATEISKAPADSNPVARWVEAVQPWMPGSSEDAVEDGQDTPDWAARSKALEFLSRTLIYLGPDILKPSQVKLLVSFFGAMLDVDHKAGVLASATALHRIAGMKHFTPSGGRDIIAKVCALKDDFPRQLAKTRLEVYRLLQLLLSDPKVASDLKRRDGASLQFMADLVHLCSNERDPDCLMLWFAITQHVITHYNPSQDALESMFANFKSYFPITLPRTSQTKVTPDELKLALRGCFAADSHLAPSAIPFLIAKMDQGEGLTVNVKLDILKTLKACLESYKDPQTSVQPFVNQLWFSLKYEVRNGELEDTIWATLEVLKTIATRVQGDHLRDYTLMVTRDCVTDLTDPVYTGPAGRLMVSVLSATPPAFVLMVSPAVTHIKENLRHPKSPLHTQALHKLLGVILQSRAMVACLEMPSEERRDLAAVDVVFKTLYSEVYAGLMGKLATPELSEDDAMVGREAVKGAGLLVSQPTLSAPDLPDNQNAARLLPDEMCSQICDSLFAIILQASNAATHRSELDSLVGETTEALQRAVSAFPASYKPLVERSVETRHPDPTSTGTWSNSRIDDLGPLMAFVGCSSLPTDQNIAMQQFVTFMITFALTLESALHSKAPPAAWISLAASMQAAVRHFSAAIAKSPSRSNADLIGDSWMGLIERRYPEMTQLSRKNASPMQVDPADSSSSFKDLRTNFVLVTLYVIRHFYRRALTSNEADDCRGLTLRSELASLDESPRLRYLHQLSTTAGLVIRELSETQQTELFAEQLAVNLFMSETIRVPTPESQAVAEADWAWLLNSDVTILSLGIFKTLRPASISRLFEVGIAQKFLLSDPQSACSSAVAAARLSILSVLGNRYKIETDDALIASLEDGAKTALTSLETSSSTDAADYKHLWSRLSSFQAIASGMVRRSPGKQATPSLQLVSQLPKAPRLGTMLARRMENLSSSQDLLDKENLAIVRPLWKQKTYTQLIKPMIGFALGKDPAMQDRLLKLNHSIAVLVFAQHLEPSIFEQDMEQISRIAIATCQIVRSGADVKAAFLILRTILSESPATLQDHLRSVVQLCIDASAASPGGMTTSRAQDRAHWLPADFASSSLPPRQRARIDAECSDLALQILGLLPKAYEERHLLGLRAVAERALTMACGHDVRKVRETARLARKNWVEMP